MHLIQLGTTGIDERGQLWSRCNGPQVPLDDAIAVVDAAAQTVFHDDEFLRSLNMAMVACDWIRTELRALVIGPPIG